MRDTDHPAMPMPPVAQPAPSWTQRTLGTLRAPRTLCLAPHCGHRAGTLSWQRVRPYELQDGVCCGPQCLEEALEEVISQALPQAFRRAPHLHRIPLGLLLLSRGVIGAAALREALLAHRREASGRIGDWLVRLGYCTEEQITAGVALQWGRPLFPLAQSQGWRQCRGWLPLGLQEELGMAPLYFAPEQSLIYVGFRQAVDFGALDAITRISRCRTEACLVSDSALAAVHAEQRAGGAASGVAGSVDLRWDGVTRAEEIAARVCQQAEKLGARQIRFAIANQYLWVRLCGDTISHLTFGIG